jgi:hypothetical protein
VTALTVGSGDSGDSVDSGAVVPVVTVDSGEVVPMMTVVTNMTVMTGDMRADLVVHKLVEKFLVDGWKPS